MKPRFQKSIGVALLVGAPATAGMLYLVGVPLVTAHFKTLSAKAGGGSAGGWVGHLSFHWSSFLLALATLLGLVLFIRSGKAAHHNRPLTTP